MEKEELIFQDCSICKSILIEEFTSIWDRNFRYFDKYYDVLFCDKLSKNL